MNHMDDPYDRPESAATRRAEARRFQITVGVLLALILIVLVVWWVLVFSLWR